MFGGNLFIFRSVSGSAGSHLHCPVCNAAMFHGELVGNLIGIADPVCQSCWYYYQPYDGGS